MRSFFWYLLLGVLALVAPAVSQSRGRRNSEWQAYGHDAGGTRFSPLKQINRANVSQLRMAWITHTGALDIKSELNQKATFETTPLMVDGRLFLTTPYNDVLALNPETGRKLWEFDSHLDRGHGYSEVTSRGVAVWHDATDHTNACRDRIFMGTIDARLISLDAGTGERCGGFGKNGEIDLTQGIDLRDIGDYQVTSAPSVAKDLVIVGSSMGDNRAVEVERGTIRAFDARSGRLRWSWDPIPWAGHAHPRTGAANAWGTISVDEEHDLVYIPTGSASPDYYGGSRKGDNKWANSVVALRASTGQFVWGFQVVHHDLWDYDVAAQPTLFRWKNDIPAIAIATKMGRIFLLNRLTGVPLYPVEERAVPPSDVEGEDASATQPSAISLVPEGLRMEDAWGITPESRQLCRDKIGSLRSEGIFTPPSLRGTIVYPGNIGGVNWGSAAYDPGTHALIVNTNHLAMWVKLIPRQAFQEDRDSAENRIQGEYGRQTGVPYGMYREALRGTDGLPCNAPPWGTVVAVDTFTGKKLWDVPLGTIDGTHSTGTINLGGPVATGGSLVFSAASSDNFIRAFDSKTGDELWKSKLPAGGQATPMTYEFHGKQYVVIAAGGHGKLGTKQGDAVIAFALP